MSNDTQIALQKKITNMFQAMQRMERLLRATERKAALAELQSRKNAAEISKLKTLLKQSEY